MRIAKRRQRRSESSSVRRYQAERLERRLMLAGVTLNGSSGNDTIELQKSGSNLIGKLNGFDVLNVADASIDEIVINAGDGNDTIYVDETGDGNSITVNGGNQNDTLYLCQLSGRVDGNLDGEMFFDGGDGSNEVIIEDYADTDGTLHQLKEFGAAYELGFGLFTLYTGEPITLNCGSGVDTVNIGDGSPGPAMTVNGNDGADVFAVGDGSIDLLGRVSLAGGAGDDSLTISDGSTGFTERYEINSGSLVVSDTGVIGTVSYSDIAGVTLNTALSDVEVNVLSTASGTSYTINANDGSADTITIGASIEFGEGPGDVEQIAGPITVNGAEADDLLHYNDAANGFDDTYSLTVNTITRTFSALVTYNAMGQVKVSTGINSNPINVLSTLSTTSYTVLATSGGADSINFGSANDVENVDGPVTVTGAGGDDTINYNDSANDFNDTYTLTSSTITRSVAGLVTYSAIPQINLNAGNNSNTINVQSTASGTSYAINATAGGADVINVGAANNVANVDGATTVTGAGGNDTLNYNDAAHNVTALYVLRASTVVRAGHVAVTYNAMGQFNLNAGSVGMDIDIEQTASGTSYQVNGGGGVDFFDVGDFARVEFIQGAVTINGGLGDTLRYDDAARASAETYTLTNSTITRTGTALVTYNFIEEIELNAGSGGDTINVLSTSISASNVINANGGADTVNIGAANNVEAIDGAITIQGGPGADVLNYNDSANTFPDTYTITAHTIGRPLSATVTAPTYGAINVNAGSAANLINIQATAPVNNNWTVNAGGGTDEISILGSGLDDNVAFAPTTITTNGTINHSAAEKYSFNSGGGTDVLGIDTVVVMLAATAKLSALNSTNGATLDMLTNDLVIDYSGASPIGSWGGSLYNGLTGAIARGMNGGAWDGNGIITSMSYIGDGTLRTVGIGESSFVLGLNGSDTDVWNGMTVDGTCVLIKYTYMGDIDLSGELNGDDYFWLDSNVLQNGTVFGYSVGDIDLSGELNGDDYFWLDSNILAAQIVGPI